MVTINKEPDRVSYSLASFLNSLHWLYQHFIATENMTVAQGNPVPSDRRPVKRLRKLTVYCDATTSHPTMSNPTTRHVSSLELKILNTGSQF